MIRAALVLLASLMPAAADPARVLSGEHGDFTRLVIELPSTDGWTVGRTSDGYAFSAKGELQPDYDLAEVWQRIDRTRLRALAADPESGALMLSLGCDCHVFPFEYQPGIIVLDIKPGPAPDASVFETAFVPPGPTRPHRDPTGATYDWLARAGTDRPLSTSPLPLPLQTGSTSLKPLRDELLKQLAEGAADGVVDMKLPGKPEKVVSGGGTVPWSNIHIGETPGLIVTQPNALAPDPRPDASCASPELLDLASWGKDRLPSDLLAEARSGLFGEFDVPDEDAVLKSVRLLLYLGFGAEARQTADLLPPEAAGAALPLYRSMSRLVDGESDPQTPFAAMLGCEGPAALWAALAYDRFPAGPGVNRDAIVQAFQALPPHLRRELGPRLAEKFLARDDIEAARIIRDSVQRAPDADPAEVALLDAKAEMKAGDTDAALSHAETAVALDGGDAESLIALVETHFRKLEPLAPDVAEQLIAMQGENDGTEKGPAIRRAAVLALALSDQIDAAFADVGGSGGSEADLWRVVQARAADDDFLLHAVLAPDANPPQADADVKLASAQRLLGLGFPDAAMTWLGQTSVTDAPEKRLLAARAETGRGNAQAAAELLAGLQGTEAASLRAKVLLQLGDLASATETLAAAGESQAAAQVSRWNEDWTALDPSTPAPWQQAAEFAKPTPAEASAGPLDRGTKSVESSLASRGAIEALLASVPSPTTN